MRTEKAIKNAIYGVIGYTVLMISNFITRAVLIRTLGNEFVGLEALFKNVISMLALAELGLGSGLVYKLYKPIAEGDNKQIKRVLNFYKKAYKLIALVIVAAGLGLSFVIHFFVEEKNYTPIYIGFVFFLFVLDVLSSYLYANRKALLLADQKNFVINQNDVFIQLSTMLVQVSLLYFLRGFGVYVSFAIYAIVKILCRLTGAVMIGIRFRRLYPEVAADQNKEIISEEERKPLMKNIGALLCHRIGAFCVNSTASLIITKFAGLLANAIYANYILIINTISQLVIQVFAGITASFGNLLSTGTKEAVRERFNQLYFMNFFIFCFCTTSLFVLAQPFIGLVFGEESVCNFSTLVLFCVYFYVYGIRRVVLMAKDSAGLFRPDRYLALLEATICIIMSVTFVQFWGINGVLLASILSMLLVPLWSQPYLVYKNVLDAKLSSYYLRYLLYTGVTFGCAALTYWVASLIPFGNIFVELIGKAVLCLIIPNAVCCLLFWRTKDFRALKALGFSLLGHVFKRGKQAE